jgi:hypothetical protein
MIDEPLPEYQGTAEKRYELLKTDRDPFLRRARACSKYTIPSLIPEEGDSGYTDYPTPYQSFGARGVNHLAGKLLLGLLPANTAFFRLMPDPKAINTAKPPLSDQVMAGIQSALAKIEQTLLQIIEARSLRVFAFEAFKHLIVGGNVLIGVTKTSTRVFPLHQYVVNRDPEGTILEIIIRECVSPEALPEKIREDVITRAKSVPGQHAKTVSIFTHIRRQGSRFTSNQEVCGIPVPGTSGNWPEDKLPYLPLRWTRIDGESYGRGHCEEYLGDLVSLEGLSQAIVEGAAGAAKLLFMVKPGSTTDPKDVAEAENLAVIQGDKEDVGALQAEKSADLQIAANTAQAIETRLSYAFLLNSAVQRDAERVTAEEIRYVANELETSLGGVYSIFSQEFQRPLVLVLLAQAMRDKSVPPFPIQSITPVIVTGVDALGRSQQFSRMTNILLQAAQILGPEPVAARIDVGAYLTAAFESEGVDKSTGVIKSEEQYQAEVQAQQQMQLAQAATPNAVKAMGDAVQAQQQNQSQQPTQQ